MSKKKIIAAVAAVAVLVAAFVICFVVMSGNDSQEITAENAEEMLNAEFDAMANRNVILKYVAEENYITVNKLTRGDNKNLILDCSVETYDIHSVVSPEYNSFLSSSVKKGNGTMYKTKLDFKIEFQKKLAGLIRKAEKVEETCKIELYETGDGWQVYTSDDVVNKVYGGVVDIADDVADIGFYTDPEGEHKIESPNVNEGFVQCFELKYSSKMPITAGFFGKLWIEMKEDFNRNFIEHDRWKTIFSGLWVTIKLTFFSLLIGIILGFIIAFIRCTYLKFEKRGLWLRFLNGICQVYLTVTRGTPVVVQIMIIYFVIFMPIGIDKFIAAVICFGLNSGAYVAEIVRGGIMSVDNGQTEAGRSLGFTYMQTMWNIVFPQAFKNVLPALANEFVVLLKETSIAFYIGLGDLMYSGNAIRAATYSPFMPLVAVAVIYLVMVLILSKLVSLLERRLRNSER